MGNATPGFKTDVDGTGDALLFTELELDEINDDLWEVGSADDDKSVWDPSASFTVEASEDNGTSYATLGAAEYSLEYLSGRVDVTNYTSGTGNTANITNVRVTGDYFPRYDIASAVSDSVETSFESLDSTVFSETDMTRIKGLGDISISVTSLDFGLTPLDGDGGSEDNVIQVLEEGRLLVISVQPDTDTEKYIRAFCLVENVSVSSSVDSRVEGEFTFVGDGNDTAGRSYVRFTRGTA